jgi:hypothetical protein
LKLQDFLPNRILTNYELIKEVMVLWPLIISRINVLKTRFYRNVSFIEVIL